MDHVIHLTGRTFPFVNGGGTATLFVLSVVLSLTLLGRKAGSLYAVSSFLQQTAMLSFVFLALPHLSYPMIVLLLVPPYAAGHVVVARHGTLKIILTSLWGCLFVALYLQTQDLLLITSLHLIGGALFLRYGLLSAWRYCRVKREPFCA